MATAHVGAHHVSAHHGSELIKLVWRLVCEEWFDPADFVLAGSARLLLTGHREQLSDIDIVARGATWERALELVRTGRGYTERTGISGDTVVRLYDGRIEVSDRWFMPGSRTDHLIDGAYVHEGLRYFTVQDLVAYKRVLDRPKDRSDLATLAGMDHEVRCPFVLTPIRKNALAAA